MLPDAGGRKLERPNVPAMENLEAAVKELHETEEALNNLKQTQKRRIEEIARDLAGQVENEDERLNAMNYLYWRVPEVKRANIEKAFFGDEKNNGFVRWVKPFNLDYYCETCGKPFQVRNRIEKNQKFKVKTPPTQEAQHKSIVSLHSKKTHYWENLLAISETVCDACRDRILAERMDKDLERRERLEATRKERLKELRAMPYWEYLKTPEWRKRRYYHLKSTGYHCQVCNASAKQKRLEVHHRKYTTLGNESFSDLTVLCANCHALFHREGKLAKENT